MPACRPIALLLLTASIPLAGCFPHEAGPRLAHFDASAPAVGDAAPRFALAGLDGAEVDLENFLGERPVVLQLGSHSCPVYRYRRFGMEKLVDEFGDRVHFLLVYTREAHPVGSKSPYAEGVWDPLWNRLTGVRVREPATLDERRELAGRSLRMLELQQTMLTDAMDNAVWQSYGAASSPAFVLDSESKVVLRQVWLDPKEIGRELRRLLETTEPAAERSPAESH